MEDCLSHHGAELACVASESIEGWAEVGMDRVQYDRKESRRSPRIDGYKSPRVQHQVFPEASGSENRRRGFFSENSSVAAPRG
jgi:hypothetical protein